MDKPATETVLQGLALSGGVGLAKVCMVNENRHQNLPVYRVTDEAGLERQCERLRRAEAVVGEQLEKLRADVEQRIGASEAGIFTVQKAILNDPALVAAMQEAVRGDRINAEAAAARVLDAYEAQLREVDNSTMRDRASDIGDVRRRLLDVLADINPSLECSDEAHCQRGRNRVIVAEELTPSLTLELDTEHTLGFVTERGGVGSHAAILANALGIPAVSGLPHIRNRLSCGVEVLVNGDTGELIVWPHEDTVRRLLGDQRTRLRRLDPVAPVAGFETLASISHAGQVETALAMRADGVGLYRTEFELLAAGRLLDEDEQAERYRKVVRALAGLPLFLRLFDIGGDKALPFLRTANENNPALGLRGARFLLENPELLRTQARAVARAASLGPIHVMYPMVSGVEEFLELKKRFAAAVADLPQVELKHGVMFEIPAACLQAKALLEVADFGSIGSNDLLQYLYAVDRDNAQVAHYYRADAPVLWELIATIAAAARERGKPLSLCGEIAGTAEQVPRLMAAGIRSVSVSPRLIPFIRKAVP